jgi:hypothetical protein
MFDADDVLHQLRKVQAVVGLLEKHPPERANAAARRAMHYGCLNYMGVKNILLKGLDLEPLDGEHPERDWASGSRFARDPNQTVLAFKERRHHVDADGTRTGTEAPPALGALGHPGSTDEGSGG